MNSMELEVRDKDWLKVESLKILCVLLALA
jgi:hypothetical protein